jgi:hypothetical protein
MLEAELLGKPYSKTAHRQALAPQLAERSDGSIEFKHQNISAVLTGLGLPYIAGYKPRGNYQALLAQEVETFLDRSPHFLDQLAAAPGVNPTQAPAVDSWDPARLIEEPPTELAAPREPETPWLSRRGRRINFVERDAANRRLGKLGEEFVMQLEQYRLRLAGRDDLAERIQWVSEAVGDGLGFDVLSFQEEDESERLIEVKTTGLGKFFPFAVTGTEVRCSEDCPGQFRLFRVFDFGRAPRAYILPGSLRVSCLLEPVQFRATSCVGAYG